MVLVSAWKDLLEAGVILEVSQVIIHVTNYFHNGGIFVSEHDAVHRTLVF